MNSLIQILMAGLGSFAFGLLFRCKPARYPWILLSGSAVWLIYLVARKLGAGLFIGTLIATLSAQVFAEVMAHRAKAPKTVFLITANIPLIPGSSLYYTMNAAVQGDSAAFLSYASMTAVTAGALAFGSMMFIALLKLLKLPEEKHLIRN